MYICTYVYTHTHTHTHTHIHMYIRRIYVRYTYIYTHTHTHTHTHIHTHTCISVQIVLPTDPSFTLPPADDASIVTSSACLFMLSSCACTACLVAFSCRRACRSEPGRDSARMQEREKEKGGGRERASEQESNVLRDFAGNSSNKHCGNLTHPLAPFGVLGQLLVVFRQL